VALWWNNQAANNRGYYTNANRFSGQSGSAYSSFNGRGTNLNNTQHGVSNTANQRALQNQVANENPAQAGRSAQNMPFNRQMPQAAPSNQAAPSPPEPVSYEALDEKSMAQIRELITKKQDELNIAPEDRKIPASSIPAVEVGVIAEKLPLEASKNEVSVKLEELIQGERNAGLFYNGLLDLTESIYIRDGLNKIISNVTGGRDLLEKIYISIAGESYLEKNTGIIGNLNIKEALSKAVEIENTSAMEMSALYDSMENSSNTKIINSIIHKKLIGINLLQQLLKTV